MVGSLIWRKGYEYSLLALRKCIDQGIPIHLTICGDGRERERVLFAIEDLGLQRNVRLLGRQTPARIRDLLRASDVFLLSSLSEGVSNAALEAMACGTPVVSTDCGGMPEAITSGQEGWIVPMRDPKAIVAALTEAWHDPARRQAMGAAARERVLTQFDLREQLNAFQNLIQRATQS